MKEIKQVLYHMTKDMRYLTNDKLISRNHAVEYKKSKSVCFTRSKLLNIHNGDYTCRIVIDTFKLKNNYKIYPIDEVYLGIVGGGSKNYSIKNFIFKKFVPHPSRYTVNNIYKYDIENGIEHEFEERVLRDIKELGKYIISIQFKESVGITHHDKILLRKYLDVYPHIKIELIDDKKLWLNPKELEPKEWTKEWKIRNMSWCD